MNHITIYRKAFDIGDQDLMFCEVCGTTPCQIHHIIFKGMGGNPEADYIENLIGLCLHCHDVAHGKIKGEELTREQLQEIVERR
jgi:5-methylcytosine-specific restriction endonuclease McrA